MTCRQYPGCIIDMQTRLYSFYTFGLAGEDYIKRLESCYQKDLCTSHAFIWICLRTLQCDTIDK